MDLNPSFIVHGLVQVFPEPEIQSQDVYRVLVRGSAICLGHGDPPVLLHRADPLASGCRVISRAYLGLFEGTPCYAEDIAADDPGPPGCYPVEIRDLPGHISRVHAGIGSFAAQTLAFSRNTRFCGRCGSMTQGMKTERAQKCPACGLVTYPRISPAVLILVRNGDRILLARSPRFPAGVHGLIAGFVEPGETLEYAAQREVAEETGVTIRNLQYMASEPWPFPDSLMIAFVADYAGGEIQVEKEEIESAAWFTRDTLPPLPSPVSLSRTLIELWRQGLLDS